MNLLKIFAAAVALAAMTLAAEAGDKRQLVVATEGAYPPYNFVDDSGKVEPDARGMLANKLAVSPQCG